MKLRALLSQCILESVQQGWIDVNTYCYTAFMHSDPLSVTEVFDYMIGQIEQFGIVTTTDIAVAVELARQVKAQKSQPQRRGWFSWFAG